MSKKIGIPGWTIEGKAFGVGLPYAEYIREFGQLIILNPDDPIRNDLDLLILPGGLDVSPSRQSSFRLSLYTGVSNPMLEYFDKHSLPKYIEQDTPIVGICRGAQSLWIHFGGELNQHNYWHKQSSHPKDECHELFWNDNWKSGSKLLNKVNSRHHQTMTTIDFVPDELEVIAWAKEGNKPELDIVEAFKHKELPIYGFQFHPEDCPSDLFVYSVIKSLLERADKEEQETEKVVEDVI